MTSVSKGSGLRGEDGRRPYIRLLTTLRRGQSTRSTKERNRKKKENGVLYKRKEPGSKSVEFLTFVSPLVDDQNKKKQNKKTKQNKI